MTTITHSRYWRPTGTIHTHECGCMMALYVETGTADRHEKWEWLHPCRAHRDGWSA
jgi:hypothetical protein